MLELSQAAFEQLQRLFEHASGIKLTAQKRALVQARLARRVRALGHTSFDAYCRWLRSQDDGEELRNIIDLLTTNESYFFREPKHFTHLVEQVHTRFAPGPLRIWSAACATGEEPYSIAMTLLDHCPERRWELVASDLSSRALERARSGVFPLQRLELLPPGYLQRFCLRGTGDYTGMLRVSDEVRRRVQFFQHNLLAPKHSLGSFDVIFLRNVLIYFEPVRKEEIVSRVLASLRPQGLLFVGHAEPLQGLSLPLRRIKAKEAVFERQLPPP